MYDYYIDQMQTDSNEARTAWETIKTQLDEVYVLGHASRGHKARITRVSNKVKEWFKRVESLMGRLPKNGQPSSALFIEFEKELGSKYLNTFSSVCDTVSELPISKDQKESIKEGIRSINDCVARMKNDLRSLRAG